MDLVAFAMDAAVFVMDLAISDGFANVVMSLFLFCLKSCLLSEPHVRLVYHV